MSRAQRDAGMKWITEMLGKLANESGVPLDSLDWNRSSADFDRGLQSLAVVVGRTRVVEKFSEADLEDCPGDRRVRAKLERRLAQVIRTLHPGGKEIGF